MVARARRREWSSRDDRAKECPPRRRSRSCAQRWSADRRVWESCSGWLRSWRPFLFVPSLAPGRDWESHYADPAQVLPLDQLAPQHREAVSEVIRDHTFHRQGETETFPCHGSLYLSLLNEPLVPLTLWKDLSRIAGAASEGWAGPLRRDRRRGRLGGLGLRASARPGSMYSWPTSATSARRSNARIDARIVLIVHSSYVRDSNKEPWVQHDVEAYVKVDSKGWKALARTVRPLIERILEDQVREAGYFISLMSRLVVTYPNWACQVVGGQPSIDPATKQRFHELVTLTRKPGASKGRPVVAQTNPCRFRSAATLKLVRPRHPRTCVLSRSGRRDECRAGSSPFVPGV